MLFLVFVHFDVGVRAQATLEGLLKSARPRSLGEKLESMCNPFYSYLLLEESQLLRRQVAMCVPLPLNRRT